MLVHMRVAKRGLLQRVRLGYDHDTVWVATARFLLWECLRCFVRAAAQIQHQFAANVSILQTVFMPFTTADIVQGPLAIVHLQVNIGYCMGSDTLVPHFVIQSADSWHFTFGIPCVRRDRNQNAFSGYVNIVASTGVNTLSNVPYCVGERTNMNRQEECSPDLREAIVRFGDGNFRILKPGHFVRCGITLKPISIDNLRYWSVERQVAYLNADAVRVGVKQSVHFFA